MLNFIECLVLRMALVGLLTGTLFGAHAQWVKTTGPDSVRSLASDAAILGDVLVQGILAGGINGVAVSENDATHWYSGTGMPNSGVRAVHIGNGRLFAGTNGRGVYECINGCSLWQSRNSGLVDSNVFSLGGTSTNLFVGTSSGVFRSTNNAESWFSANTGLTKAIRALTAVDSTVYAGTDSGLFVSLNLGFSWLERTTGLPTTPIRTLVRSGSAVYAGTANGVFKTTNHGGLWTAVNSGLTSLDVRAMAVHGEHMFAGTDSGVFVSSDHGATWASSNTGFGNTSIRALTVAGGGVNARVVLAATDSGIWRRPISEMVTSIVGTPSETKFGLRIDAGGDVAFHLVRTTRVMLTAHAMTGRKVTVLLNGHYPAGRHEARVASHELPNGLYVYRLDVGAESLSRKVAHTRD